MADIAIFRINYKSDFILTLNSDAGWATPFCIKFWTGAPSQAYYAYYDGMSYTHCAPVDGEPTKLLVQFDDHHLPIGDLKFQIGYHFTVADFPTSVEDEVINQAAVIIGNDDERQQVMLDFNGETAPEIQFSLPAYVNEAQRIANEQARIAAEEQRIANEQARISAEETRQANEQQRINAEAERVREFASLKNESEAATDAANIAATLANEKAQLADDKAALAQAAADLANAKAQLAADKAALAQTAATLANEKAALAQQKAEYAQEQGDAAKTEAETAHALNEEVRDDEEARDQAEQIRQQQETARQQAESQRVTDFNAQMQQQQTAYTDAEAARDTAFDEAETERDAKVEEKVADITNLQAQIGYFVCDTAAATAAKTIAATGYALTTGGNIRIKMTNANTADAVTLNINNTGAKALFYNGEQASSTNSWEAGEVVEVYYDGTQFQCQANKGGEDAKNIAYNNTNSNLNADNVQDAIDEFVVDRSETVNLIDCIPNTRLKQDGTTASLSSFYTSDFINVSNATKIYTNSLYGSDNVYTGIVFYTQSKQVIFTPFVIGDIPNTIDMTNFKDASYIRVCGGSGASISIDTKAVIQPIQYPETIERVVNTQKEYTKTDAIYTNNVLYANGTIGTGQSKYSVTPFIKISGATRIITNALWNSGGSFAGLVLYAADSHTVIRYIKGTNDVDITGENAVYMRVMFSDNQNEKVVVVTNTTACYISAESVLYGESNVGNEIDKLNEKVNSPTDAVYTIEDTESSGILKEDGTITRYGNWKYKRINIPEFCNLIKFSGLYGVAYGYSGGGIFDKNNNLISHLNQSGVIDLKCYPNASYVIFCADTVNTPNATLILSNKEDNELYVYNYYGVKCRLGEDIDNNIIFKTTQYKNVVVLGNSLTWHEYYPSFGWYGTNRSMASTTTSVSWTNQLQKILQKKESGAIVTGVMTRSWERAGDGNRNHNIIKQLLDDALTNDVDLIIFRTGENANVGNINVFETEIKELLDYCLSIAKKAEVLMTSCFWENNNKDTAIKNVAEERHYMFISTGSRFSYHKELKGDFMVDDTDNVEKMLTNIDVCKHTNDVGFYMFTDYLASYLGYGDLLLNEMFDISVDSTLTNGYKIKELKAQRDALVTVLTYESNQPTISVVDENENAIPTNVHDITGTSTYTYAFTFIMPQSNVNITLS